jgi:hypothetical protein
VTLPRWCALALLLLCGAARLPAQGSTFTPGQPASSSQLPGSEITVTLVTFGVGEQVVERFGHNALWFHDARTLQDVAYHWGLYDFDDPGFLFRFLTGDTHYSMAPMSAEGLIAAERSTGRPVTLQRLALTPAQALALRDFVHWNEREENKYYRYDYYRDNCSTRLRDALDRALGGALRRSAEQVPTELTYRSESLRLTDGDVPVQTGIDIALGRPADRPLTRWESFFIPMRLRDAVRELRVADGAGGTRPLVAAERFLPPPPGTPHVTEAAQPPHLIPRYLAAGVLLAAVVVGLRVMMVSRRSAAWGLAIFGAGWSLLCGVLGVILLLAWFATRHVFWSHNEHVLLLSPLSLPLVVLLPALVLSGRMARAARGAALVVAACGLFALLLALLPGGQRSGAAVALFLPVHLAVAWALLLPRLARTPRT